MMKKIICPTLQTMTFGFVILETWKKGRGSLKNQGGAMTYKETSKVCCMRGIWSAVAGFEDEGRGP